MARPLTREELERSDQGLPIQLTTLDADGIPVTVFQDAGGMQKYNGVQHDAVTFGIGLKGGDNPLAAHQQMVERAARATLNVPVDNGTPSGSTLGILTVTPDGKIYGTSVADPVLIKMVVDPQGNVVDASLLNRKSMLAQNPDPYRMNVISSNMGGESGQNVVEDLRRNPSKFQTSADMSADIAKGNRVIMIAASDGLMDHLGAVEGSGEGLAQVNKQIDTALKVYAATTEEHLKKGGKVDAELAAKLNKDATDLGGKPDFKDNTSLAMAEFTKDTMPTRPVTLVAADGNGIQGRVVSQAIVQDIKTGFDVTPSLPSFPNQTPASNEHTFNELGHEVQSHGKSEDEVQSHGKSEDEVQSHGKSEDVVKNVGAEATKRFSAQGKRGVVAAIAGGVSGVIEGIHNGDSAGSIALNATKAAGTGAAMWAGGEAGAVAGAWAGSFLAPFTFGLSVPVFGTVGAAVGAMGAAWGGSKIIDGLGSLFTSHSDQQTEASHPDARVILPPAVPTPVSITPAEMGSALPPAHAIPTSPMPAYVTLPPAAPLAHAIPAAPPSEGVSALPLAHGVTPPPVSLPPSVAPSPPVTLTPPAAGASLVDNPEIVSSIQQQLHSAGLNLGKYGAHHNGVDGIDYRQDGKESLTHKAVMQEFKRAEKAGLDMKWDGQFDAQTLKQIEEINAKVGPIAPAHNHHGDVTASHQAGHTHPHIHKPVRE